MKFRYDINALRALAVTVVVLFHYGAYYKVDFISGGYVGVDVFFVISGCLMTSIVMGRLAKGRFSIWDFYYDRAKRIVPGLLGMCFVLLAAGYFLLEPASYHDLGSTTIAALLFFSNFWFWETTSYFDADSNTKWLLHTWSLSVEWQFYLIYPIILMGLHAFEKTRRIIVPILWSMAFLSLLSCIWFSTAEPASAFYLLPQRAWELLAGGIVALQFENGGRKYSRMLLASGLLFIGLSIAFYDKNTPWPYYWALLPAIGTCLVIAANRADASIFRSQLIQTTGKWSYSIYLWHWPVVVAALYFDFKATTPLKIAYEILILAAIIASGGFLVSLVKGISSEKLAKARLPAIALGGGALALSVAFAILVTTNEGLPNRWTDGDRGREVYKIYKMAAHDWDYPKECDGMGPGGILRPCRLGLVNDGGVLFIGDSYTMQFYSRFVENAKLKPQTSFTFLASSGCPPVTGVRMVHDRFHCNGFFEKALQFAEAHHFTRILLVASWYGYFNPADGRICFLTGDGCRKEPEPSSYFQHVDTALATLGSRLVEFRKRGVEIVIVGATPAGDWDVPVELAKRRFLGRDTNDIAYIDRDEFEKYVSPIKSRLKFLASSVGAKFVDPLDFLCAAHRCPTIDSDGVPYFKDRAHFRSRAVRTSRFQFLDDAAGVNNRLSAVPVPRTNTP